MSARDDLSRGRALTIVCAALIGFALIYAAVPYTRLPNLLYDALARRFLVGNRPVPVQLGYFGQILWAMAGALVAATLAWLVARRRAIAPGTRALMTAWALAAIVIVGAFFTWQNWP